MKQWKKRSLLQIIIKFLGIEYSYVYERLSSTNSVSKHLGTKIISLPQIREINPDILYFLSFIPLGDLNRGLCVSIA